MRVLQRYLSLLLIFSVSAFTVPRFFQHQCEAHFGEHLPETTHVHEGDHTHVCEDNLEGEHSHIEFVHDGSLHVESDCAACDVDLILTFDPIAQFDFSRIGYPLSHPSEVHSALLHHHVGLSESRGPPQA